GKCVFMSDQNVVELGGEPRELILDFKGAKALNRATGDGLLVIHNKLQQFDTDILERVLWASLLHKEPTLTISLVAKRVEAYQSEHKTIAPLVIAAGKAMNDSGLFNMPSEEEMALGKNQAATAT